MRWKAQALLQAQVSSRISRGWRAAREVEHFGGPPGRLLAQGHAGQVADIGGDARREIDFLLLQRPAEGRAQIVHLAPDPEIGLGLVGAAPLLEPAARLRGEEGGMPGARSLELGGAALDGKLADRLEHAVAHRAVVVGRCQQRLTHQRIDEVEHVVPGDRAAGAHGLRRLERAAAGEDRGAHQRQPLGLAQQVVRPLHRMAQGLVAAERPPPAAQQPEALVEALEDLARAHRPHARRGKLDGERNAVEAAADLDHRSGIALRPEARQHRARPLGEQRDCRRVHAGRRCQRRQGQDALAVDREGLAAGCQHRQPRTALQELADQLRHRLDQVLAIVEHQQEPALAQHLDHAGDQGPVRLLLDAELSGNGVPDGLRIADGGELAQPGAVVVAAAGARRGLQHEPRLADTAHARDVHEPRLAQQARDLGQLPGAAEQRRGRRRQVAAARLGGDQRRKGLAQARAIELEQTMAPLQAAQAMLAEIGQLVAFQQPGAEVRQQDLPAMAGRHDARGAVQRRTEIVAVAQLGLAGADAHAHRQFEAALRSDRRIDRAARRGKGGGDAVAGVLEEVAAMGPHRLTQDGVVRRQGPAHRLGIVLPARGRADDVGHQERHGAGGLFGHGGAVSARNLRTSPGAVRLFCQKARAQFHRE
jgi:hypothetical protein